MRGNCYAWVVLIPEEDALEKALYSGETLRKTKSSAPVIALCSSTLVGSKRFKQVEMVFEAVFVSKLENAEIETEKLTLLLVYLMKMTMFSKLVILRPGVLILEQSDELFDLGNKSGFILMDDKRNDWSILGIRPSLTKYRLAISKLGKNSHWEIAFKAIFGSNWKNAIRGQVRQYMSEENKEKIVELAMEWKRNELENFEVNSEGLDSENHEDTRNWIAIVGMSCRFPDANSLDEYWELLKNGRNTSSFPPEHRLKLTNAVGNRKGNYLKCPINEFDSAFFAMSPSEACLTDPQTRILLEVSWEAFENAGINPENLRGSCTGVFHGSWVQEYKEVLNNEGSDPKEDYIRKYLSNAFGSTAAKLSFFYGFTGTNIASESGCSSSLVAVDLACKSLKNGECPVALATGANIIVHLDAKQAVIWSDDAICKTFDSSANGYGRAEGIAVLVLKRYSDAIRDNDRIHGIIRGIGASQEGLSRSFGSPTVESEAEAMRKALAEANVDPSEVSYLEAHATGTNVGDPIEAAAIVQAYKSEMERDRPLVIGSGKTNIGHTESCSGLAGIIKVLLAMKHEMIPPHLNLNSMSSSIDFSEIPGVVSIQPIKWDRDPSRSKPRLAGVSSFGITGTDVHLILQEPPERTPKIRTESESDLPGILTWSAMTEASLELLTHSYIKTIASSSNVSVPDMAYASNICRAHHPFRRAIVISRNISKDALVSSLGNGFHGKTSAHRPKICFVFPPGKYQALNRDPAKYLYHHNSQFKSNFDDADRTFKGLYGASLLSVFLDGIPTTDVEEMKCVEWLACQLATQYALVKLLECWGIKPYCVIGHCHGEIGAAMLSGSLDLENGFKVIMATSEFARFQKNNKAEMMAIRADQMETEAFITEFLVRENSQTWVDISIINSPTQTIVTAPSATMNQFQEFLQTRNIKCKPLGLVVAAHSRIVEDAYESAMKIFSAVKHKPCKIPYVSSITGKIIREDELQPEFWYKLWRESVKYTSACQTVDNQLGPDIMLEIDMDSTLTKLSLQNFSESSRSPLLLNVFYNARQEDGWTAMMNTIAQLYTLGIDIDWESFHKMLGHKRQVLDLPHYPFQRKSFWFERKKNISARVTEYAETPAIIHPLLGFLHGNAIGHSIFRGEISKGTVPYIFDHVVGTHVIFPGAAFLEMILAAASHDLKSSSNGTLLAVENFEIWTALHLDPVDTLELQTMFESGGFSVWAKHTDKWQKHATGQISIRDKDDFDHTDVSNIMERCNQPLPNTFVQDCYDQLAKVGLNFGSQFKSIIEVYKGPGEILAKITPSIESEGYLLHPTIIDAMIQTFIFHAKPKLEKLYVPVKIGAFYLNITEANDNKELYVNCKAELSGLFKTIHLLNGSGTVIAEMKNLELTATSIDSIASAIAVGKGDTKVFTEVPLDVYETVWAPSKNVVFAQTSGVNDWVVLHNKQLKEIQCLKKEIENVGGTTTFVELTNFLSNQENVIQIFRKKGILFWVEPQKEPLECEGILKPLLLVAQFLNKTANTGENSHNIHIATSGAWCTTADSDPALATLWGFMRTLRVEMKNLISKSIDFDTNMDAPTKAKLICQEICLVVEENYETELVYWDGTRKARRLKHDDLKSKIIGIPKDSRFCIALPDTRIMTDLQYTRDDIKTLLDDQVEVQIKCSSLNFRDVMCVLKPSKYFEQFNTVGLDYSGVISRIGGNVKNWKVGDSVFGCNWIDGTIKSHLVTSSTNLIELDDNLTFEEGATLPVVFLTAWYCMVNIANLRQGQTILVHAASGGVGLMAIQIANILQVNIIGTAGSSRKRRYLRSLGIRQVFDSRTLEYREKVLDITQGNGVDMVLNCLTGPGFKEASLDVCRVGGYFVEISKLDVWQNHHVQERKPGVNYEIVDVTTLPNAVQRNIFDKLVDLLKNARIKPLPYTRFTASAIVNAMIHLQSAKQIGKVVISMPELNKEVGEMKENLFNMKNTYLITGGRGSIGMSLAKWMSSQGAKYIALLGRSAPNDETLSKLKDLEEKGCRIVNLECDIGNYEELKEILEKLKSPTLNLPPVRGVIHAAGALSDNLVGNQSWGSFKYLWNAKVKGAQNLHRLTRHTSLEFFCMISSLTCTMGNYGQINYTAMNAYLDSLAQLRYSMGLPGLAINLGHWRGGLGANANIPWLPAFSDLQGISGFDYVFRTKIQSSPLVQLGLLHWDNLIKMAPYYEKTLLENLDPGLLHSGNSKTLKTKQPLRQKQSIKTQSLLDEYIQLGKDDIGKRDLLRRHVIKTVCDVLGMMEEEIEDDDADFSVMGMDSFMSIEFSNKLMSEIHTGTGSAGFIDVEENGSVNRMTTLLTTIIEAKLTEQKS